MEDPGNLVMYYLSDGPDRAFMSEELMLIPEDTEKNVLSCIWSMFSTNFRYNTTKTRKYVIERL